MARPLRACITSLLVGLAALSPAPASADGPFEGEWRAGPLSIRNEVRQWGSDCGPRPPATQREGGGNVAVAQTGDHLRFSGSVRGGTNRCWSGNRDVRRISGAYQSGRWTVRCRTPDDHSQPERGTYTLRAEGTDRITFEEVTEWDWRLRSSRCVATRRASRTFTRVGQEPAPPTAPDPPPEPPEPACDPGPAARIRLRPATSQVAPGERVCLNARVVDARGCAVPGRRVRYELRHAAQLSGRLEGRCFHAADTSAEAEGLFRIIATSEDLRAQATIRVAPVDLSDLTARTEGGQALQQGGNAEANEAAGVSARTAEREDSLLLPIVGGVLVLLLLLGAVAAVVVVRRKKPPAHDDSSFAGDIPSGLPAPDERKAPSHFPTQAPVEAPVEPSPPRETVCPECGTEYAGVQAFCPKDATRLVLRTARAAEPAEPAESFICPTCRRGYPANVKVCPHDSATLVPYSAYLAQQKAADAQVPDRRCPSCGKTFDGKVAFCPEDGTRLA